MRYLILVFALLLGACQTVPSIKGSSSAAPYYKAISLSGRLSVSYQQLGKAQSLQGKFTWDQTANTTSIALFTPLGQTIAQIMIEPERAMLQQTGEALRIAKDINVLTSDALGWPLPVHGLKEWLQGFYTNALGQQQVVMRDTQTGFIDSGWEVQYVLWQEDGSGYRIPKRIDLKHLSKRHGEINLKIVLDSWTPK
jgi:outer membrane lipoprotein LolB